MTNAADSDLIGQVLGGTYKIERLLGEGGMGAVYEASHTRVPRRFAVKMLHAEALTNKEVYQRFRREAEIASSIGHDNIVQVFDFNQTPAGVPFMVLELLKGEDLEQRLARVGRLSLAETAQILEQLASGLEAAHKAGVVHRDLKPPNLFLCPRSRGAQRVKILDFGISKITTSNSMATRTGSIMGTPNFMSPEQADGRVGEIDSRTDVFALACIIFQCLTGKFAFSGPTVMGTLYQIVHGEPADLTALAPALPEGIKTAIRRALEKDLAVRTQTVTELCDEFLAACPSGTTEGWAATVAPVSASVATPAVTAAGTAKAKARMLPTTLSASSGSRELTSFPEFEQKRGLMGWLIAGAAAIGVGATLLIVGAGNDQSAEKAPAAAQETAPATAASIASPVQAMQRDAGVVTQKVGAEGIMDGGEAPSVTKDTTPALSKRARKQAEDAAAAKQAKDAAAAKRATDAAAAKRAKDAAAAKRAKDAVAAKRAKDAAAAKRAKDAAAAKRAKDAAKDDFDPLSTR